MGHAEPLALGGEASLLFSRGSVTPHFNYGFSLGAFFAPTGPPGTMGGDCDLGGVHLSLAGGFDG